MEITIEKSLEIAKHLDNVITHINAITEEELEAYINVGRREEAISPLIDPTAWRDGGRSDSTRQTIKVFQALLDFKRTVKGIGKFI